MILLVREVEGPDTVEAGGWATYRATAFNRIDPSEAEKREINWLVRCDGEDYLSRENGGDRLTVEIPDEFAGKTLLVMAYRNSPTPNISVVTQVRPGPGQILREELDRLRSEFADILGGDAQGMSDSTLADRVKALKFAVDDLLDSAEHVWLDEGDVTEGGGRLAIIVGHTERRPGARALPPIDEHEYRFNQDVAQRMEQAAAGRGIATRTFLRDGVGIRGAYRAAAAFEPDAIIELHFNSFQNPVVRGTETLCSELNANSKRFAEVIQQAMVRVFGRAGSTDRGVKIPHPDQSGYINVTAAPGVPSVLVEPFFGSNESECRLAVSETADYAEALVNGFEEFAIEVGRPANT